jgi:hypothetical protein
VKRQSAFSGLVIAQGLANDVFQRLPIDGLDVPDVA